MIAENSVSVDGVEASYCERGSGEPIMFLRCASFDADEKSFFHRRLDGLSEQLWVIDVDQLHFGGTVYPADHTYVAWLSRVDHVIAFIQALGLKQIAQVGNSEGSFVVTHSGAERLFDVAREVIVIN